MILRVTDLNCRDQVCDPAMGSIGGVTNVRGQAGLCTSHGAPAAAQLPQNRYPLCGRAESEVVLLSRSIPVHGVCSADLSGESARHRSVSASPALQALST